MHRFLEKTYHINLIKRKERDVEEGTTPFIYGIKIYEYRSSLRMLIRKLCIFFTYKNVRKKLKVLVAFLSKQKNRRQLGLLTHWFFSKSSNQSYEKAI